MMMMMAMVTRTAMIAGSLSTCLRQTLLITVFTHHSPSKRYYIFPTLEMKN